MIKAVLIDIDDTLLDFVAATKEAMRVGFEKFSLGKYDESVHEIFKGINSKMWRDLEEGSITFEELKRTRWNNVFKALNITFDGYEFELYFREFLFNCAIHVDGAKELLDYLKGKYVLACASNGPFEQQINRLKVGGFYNYFNHHFISEAVGHQKPSKEFFSFCLNEINERLSNGGKEKLLPDEVIMIGDSLTSDIAGAIGSGIKCIYFDSHKKGSPDNIKPDYTVTSLKEICKIL